MKLLESSHNKGRLIWVSGSSPSSGQHCDLVHLHQWSPGLCSIARILSFTKTTTLLWYSRSFLESFHHGRSSSFGWLLVPLHTLFLLRSYFVPTPLSSSLHVQANADGIPHLTRWRNHPFHLHQSINVPSYCDLDGCRHTYLQQFLATILW